LALKTVGRTSDAGDIAEKGTSVAGLAGIVVFSVASEAQRRTVIACHTIASHCVYSIGIDAGHTCVIGSTTKLTQRHSAG